MHETESYKVAIQIDKDSGAKLPVMATAGSAGAQRDQSRRENQADGDQHLGCCNALEDVDGCHLAGAG